ncbi:hypothetical protein [Diaminobutyricimonas sp. TR449]|uniref:hypothetical protein n=1 Tax=Diaminobutyricimonas sp. TR449 TaxID=2708076 RepID=UPI001423C74A|nr:hypothetical protein [Diaminobutyricimonas sp. TR449]
MRRAAAAALIAAVSVLGLAACSGPLEISLFSDPQDDTDRSVDLDVLSDSINLDSVRHLADADGLRYFAAISSDGYCVFVVDPGIGSAGGCSQTLPASVAGQGKSVQLVPDNYSAHDGDGWRELTPNLLIH